MEKKKRFDTFVKTDILISNMNSIKTFKQNEKLGRTSGANAVETSEQLWHPCYPSNNVIVGQFDSMDKKASGD